MGSYPFLDYKELGLEFGKVARSVAPLYEHIIHAQRPSLCFMGVPLAVPCPVPFFEAQARFLAAHLCRNFTSREEREAWVSERLTAVGERPQDMHFLEKGAWAYMTQLTRKSALLDPATLEAHEVMMATKEQVYRDRVAKKPGLPWDDDWYRRCEYDVDWATGKWTVKLPP